MVMPHAEIALERLLINVEEIVVRSDAAPGMHVLERLELGQLELGQCLRVCDERQHLFAPLRVQTFPVLVVVERAGPELIGATGDLRRIGNRIPADVNASVDDAVVDAERGGNAVNPGTCRSPARSTRLQRSPCRRLTWAPENAWNCRTRSARRRLG